MIFIKLLLLLFQFIWWIRWIMSPITVEYGNYNIKTFHRLACCLCCSHNLWFIIRLKCLFQMNWNFHQFIYMHFSHLLQWLHSNIWKYLYLELRQENLFNKFYSSNIHIFTWNQLWHKQHLLKKFSLSLFVVNRINLYLTQSSLLFLTFVLDLALVSTFSFDYFKCFQV